MTVCPLLLLLSAAWEQLCSGCLCRPPWPWAGNSQCVGALRHRLPPLLWHLWPHLLPDRSTVVCTLFSCTTASHIPVHTLTDTQMHTHMHSHPPCAPHKHTHTHVHTYSWTKILPLTLMHTPPHPEFSGSTCIRTHSLRFHCHKVWPAQSPTGAVVDGLKYTILTSNNYMQE